MEAKELKACPFCGRKPSVSTYETESLWSHNQVTYTRIGCNDCDIAFNTEPGHELEAPAAWNRRAPSPDTVVVGREEIARIIDPEAWWRFEERRQYLSETYAELDELDPLNLRNEERLNPSLAKADAILALCSLPVEGGE